MRIYIRPTAFPALQREELKRKFPHHEWIEEDASSHLADAWIAFPQSVTKSHLDLMPNLKWIHLLMAGFNTVDLADLDRRGIVLTNSKDVFSIQIAEDVFSKIPEFLTLKGYKKAQTAPFGPRMCFFCFMDL